jgi:hypothetical protein
MVLWFHRARPPQASYVVRNVRFRGYMAFCGADALKTDCRFVGVIFPTDDARVRPTGLWFSGGRAYCQPPLSDKFRHFDVRGT